jgi:tetratricopeptide (TPR) repeat protein
MTIDDHNPRIIGNIADTYRKLGLKDKYFGMLQHAVTLQSPDPGIYSNMGVEYANRGDTARAIEYNERAVAMDSTQRLAHANLGILYATRKNFALADLHFTKAIDLGMREAPLFRYEGDICAYRGEYQRALQYYNAYLDLVPDDQHVRMNRNQILMTLTKSQR